jgi:regulator of nonsense transcripts 1
MLRSRQITSTQIHRLEDLWKSKPEASLEDLDKPGVDEQPNEVETRYEDGYHYKEILQPLILLEAEYDKQMKHSQTQESVSLTWSTALNKKYVATFVFDKPEAELRLLVGDELRLELKSGSTTMWQGTGLILRINDGEVSLEMRSNAGIRTDVRYKTI